MPCNTAMQHSRLPLGTCSCCMHSRKALLSYSRPSVVWHMEMVNEMLTTERQRLHNPDCTTGRYRHIVLPWQDHWEAQSWSSTARDLAMTLPTCWWQLGAFIVGCVKSLTPSLPAEPALLLRLALPLFRCMSAAEHECSDCRFKLIVQMH